MKKEDECLLGGIGVGVSLMFFLLLFLYFLAPTYVPGYEDGYLQAYTEYKNNTIENKAPDRIKMLYEINLIRSNYRKRLYGDSYQGR